MSKRKFPEHIGPSRVWKARKRRELRELELALTAFRVGCAYTPGYPEHIVALTGAVKKLRALLSIKEWGR